MTPTQSLQERLIKLAHLRSAIAILQWDQEVIMPSKGVKRRAETLAELSRLLHEGFVNIDHDGLLTKLHQQLEKGSLTGDEAAIVREVWRDYSREQKLPTAFVEELTLLCAEAQHVWANARSANNFKTFAPYLQKVVDMKRQEAKLVGFSDSPYDALVNQFEPGITTAILTPLFQEQQDFLTSFLKKIQKSAQTTNPALRLGSFARDKQIKLHNLIAQAIGYDFEAGAIHESTHPFATNFHPEDVRITTRYSDKDVFYSLGSVIHEVGHALYEQGFATETFGTPLSEPISFGIHESQSRFWENYIGKSLPFWEFFYPKLQAEFPKPFANLSLHDFYAGLNHVTPSLIRTESDEVTYNLHIIIRYEIEKALMEESIGVEDLPTIWNQKYKDYLGIDVPNDTQGVLQDVHWSMGGIGYFPSYALGNLYAAQFYEAMKKSLDVDSLAKAGEFGPILSWLREHIHHHGRRYSANDIMQTITGQPLSAHAYKNYITQKFSAIYKV